MDVSEKRLILHGYAQDYLDSKNHNNVLVNDGISNSTDFEYIKFLMFTALVFSKEEYPSIFSLDIDTTSKEREDFINSQYDKLCNLKKSNSEKGKKLIEYASEYYTNKYLNNELDIDLDEIGRKFGFK